MNLSFKINYFIIIIIVYIIYLLYTYFTNNKKSIVPSQSPHFSNNYTVFYENNNKTNISNDTNIFLEKYGNSIKKNTLFEKINLSLKRNTVVILTNKITNIIIGRFKLKDNILNKRVYSIVNIYIKELNYSEKQLKYILNDKYKLDELIDNVTLSVSRFLVNSHFNIEPISKIMISQYIIKYTNSNKEINDMYKFILDIASNNNYSENERMNAVDVLLLSNNTKYNNIANNLLNNIINGNTNKNIEKLSPYQIKLNKLLNKNNSINKSNITNVINVQNTNTNRLLVDLNGTTYPIPPDIDTPPLLRTNLPNISDTSNFKLPGKSVYEDRQNVHNSTINDTTIKTALELIKNYSPSVTLSYIQYKEKNISPNDILKIENSILRINTDTSKFKGKFSLYELYQSLLNFIEKHEHKNELYQRLKEELIDMNGQCATGHLSRLINVLQGFETNFTNKVVLNIDDEVYAKIKHTIEKEIQESENMDGIMDDMLSDDKIIYFNFIKDVIRKHFDNMCNEYSDTCSRDNVKNSIVKGLNKYTNTEKEFDFITIL